MAPTSVAMAPTLFHGNRYLNGLRLESTTSADRTKSLSCKRVSAFRGG